MDVRGWTRTLVGVAVFLGSSHLAYRFGAAGVLLAAVWSLAVAFGLEWFARRVTNQWADRFALAAFVVIAVVVAVAYPRFDVQTGHRGRRHRRRHPRRHPTGRAA